MVCSQTDAATASGPSTVTVAYSSSCEGRNGPSSSVVNVKVSVVNGLPRGGVADAMTTCDPAQQVVDDDASGPGLIPPAGGVDKEACAPVQSSAVDKTVSVDAEGVITPAPATAPEPNEAIEGQERGESNGQGNGEESSHTDAPGRGVVDPTAVAIVPLDEAQSQGVACKLGPTRAVLQGSSPSPSDADATIQTPAHTSVDGPNGKHTDAANGKGNHSADATALHTDARVTDLAGSNGNVHVSSGVQPTEKQADDQQKCTVLDDHADHDAQMQLCGVETKPEVALTTKASSQADGECALQTPSRLHIQTSSPLRKSVPALIQTTPNSL